MKLRFTLILLLASVFITEAKTKKFKKIKKVIKKFCEGKGWFGEDADDIHVAPAPLWSVCPVDPAQVTWDDIKALYPNLFKNSTEITRDLIGDSAKSVLSCDEVGGQVGYCLWPEPDCDSDMDESCETCEKLASPLDSFQNPDKPSERLYPVVINEEGSKSYQTITIGMCGDKRACSRACTVNLRQVDILVSDRELQYAYEFMIFPVWWAKLPYPSHCSCSASPTAVISHK